MSPTKTKIKASLNALMALAESIRELGEVPSGELYSVVMSHMDIETYTSFIARLVSAGLVENKNHLLIWKGADDA